MTQTGKREEQVYESTYVQWPEPVEYRAGLRIKGDTMARIRVNTEQTNGNWVEKWLTGKKVQWKSTKIVIENDYSNSKSIQSQQNSGKLYGPREGKY